VITGEVRWGCTRERLAGFRSRLAEAGHPLDPRLVQGADFTFEGGLRATTRLLQTGIAFDSVFAHNDLSAAGALQALGEAKLRVPQDVAVVGFDDVPLAAYTNPPLSTVRQPMRGMGEAAARLLMSHLDGGEQLPDEPRIVPTELVVRGSSHPQAAGVDGAVPTQLAAHSAAHAPTSRTAGVDAITSGGLVAVRGSAHPPTTTAASAEFAGG
jgi:LacI family transcriptional regulator